VHLDDAVFYEARKNDRARMIELSLHELQCASNNDD